MANAVITSSPYHKLVNAFVALGSLTYGFSSAIIGGTLGQPGFYSNFGLAAPGEPGYAPRTANVIATSNGLYAAGAAVTCLIVMWSADRLGRIRNIQAGSALVVLGGAFQAGGATLAMFQAGRWLAGMGIGVLVTLVPMYQAELSNPLNRGWQVGHHAIFLVFGYTLAGWIQYGCYFATDVNSSFAWRFPLAIQSLWPFLLLVGSFWTPESPRWLLGNGQSAKAFEVLRKLHSRSGDDLFAREEYYQIREQLKFEHERRAVIGNRWKAVWTVPSYRRRMILGFMTQFICEFSGPLVIYNYLVILLTNLGQTGMWPLLLSGLYATGSGLIYNPLGAWLHDRVNSRRWMLLVGLIGALVTLVLECALTAVYANSTNRGGLVAAIVMIYLYVLFQGTCIDTTMYLYVSEIFPMEIRAIGMGWSLFGQFAATILVLQTAPIGFANIEWRYFLALIVPTAVSIPFVYIYWPETARLSLEEIGIAFGDDVAVKITDASHASPEELRRIEEFLAKTDILHLDNADPSSSEEHKDSQSATPSV